MAGVDPRSVQGLLGHKTIQMTIRYAHLAPKYQLAAIQRLCQTEAESDESSQRLTRTKADTSVSGTTNVNVVRMQ
jgi:hypothetical protein